MEKQPGSRQFKTPYLTVEKIFEKVATLTCSVHGHGCNKKSHWVNQK